MFLFLKNIIITFTLASFPDTLKRKRKRGKTLKKIEENKTKDNISHTKFCFSNSLLIHDDAFFT